MVLRIMALRLLGKRIIVDSDNSYDECSAPSDVSALSDIRQESNLMSRNGYTDQVLTVI